MTPDQVTAQVASLLLDYPDQTLVDRLPVLRKAVAGLPSRDRFERFLGYAATSPLKQQQAGYVATFDLKRTCCLYLTYYACGDTRKQAWPCCGSGTCTAERAST